MSFYFFITVFSSACGVLFAQKEDEKNLQKYLERADLFLKVKDGIYGGKYTVISGKKISVSDLVLYVRGNSRAYHFYSNSHGHYATLVLADRWYFFDLLRNKKIALEGPIRKEPAGDVGFPPVVLYSYNFEKNYSPEKSVVLSKGNLRIFMKGLTNESYLRLSLELNGDRPVLIDFYDENLTVSSTLRFDYRNEMQTPGGKPADEKDFPDHMELMDLKTRVIYRITYQEYDAKVPDESFFKKIIDNRGIFYAPQADNSSLSR